MSPKDLIFSCICKDPDLLLPTVESNVIPVELSDSWMTLRLFKMKNIAPDIFRQRLLIEGFYTIDVTRDVTANYLCGIAEHLGLRIYGQPIVFSPAGAGKEENQGFDGFVPLIDSGISAYIWTKAKFFSIVLYTCKGFDEQEALQYTHDYFKVTGELIHLSF